MLLGCTKELLGRSRQDSRQRPQTMAPRRSGAKHYRRQMAFGLQVTDEPFLSASLPACMLLPQLLKQAAQLLKPGGKLLLLQHGRGTWGYINRHIDAKAERHHQTYGCWYNRDILDIVNNAGLQVESLSRWHFGTTYLIVATPGQQQAEADAAQAA